MTDHGEMSKVSLDARIHERLGSGVTQWRPVLIEKVHQLFTNKS